MLNLLIVDDEVITREGITDGLQWKEMGISEIIQAEDGRVALEIAHHIKLDIILTDVRMPCMDGIEMAEEIRGIYPDCKIIFMSGYSDKEYLLSAIKLKANSYIEKPIKREELKRVMEEVIQLCTNEEYRKLKDAVIQKKLDISIPFVKSKIALLALNENINTDLIDECFVNEMLDFKLNSNFITIIVRVFYDGKINQNELCNRFENMLGEKELTVISAFKDDEYIIMHVSSSKEKFNGLQQNYIRNLFLELTNTIEYKRIFLSIGMPVIGFTKICESYKTALEAMKKCFFRGYGSIVCYAYDKTERYEFNEEIMKLFDLYVSEGKKAELTNLIKDILSELKQKENTDIDTVKDIYYKFALNLYNRLQEYGVHPVFTKNDSHILWKKINEFNIIEEIMNFLLQYLSDYFNCIEKLRQDNNIIKIMDYIQKNYMNKDLGVREISTNTFLSPAYMCTYFKQETGKTINQYITEYRIKMAKEFLSNKEYRVSEVAEFIGYNDGNYFTRLFKKKVGISPSDYRERVE